MPTASPTPKPTPTPLPTTSLPSASAATLSTFTIDSMPRGLAVSIDGGAAGVTPATAAPNYANVPHAIVVQPSASASPYAVSFAQSADGPHTVFYNQAVDTQGKISSGAAATALRRASSLAPFRNPQRAPHGIADSPAYSADRLAIRYDLSRIGSRSLASIESAHAVTRAITLSSDSHFVTRVLTLAAGIDRDALANALRSEPGVASVDLVRLRYPLAYSGPVYPNDPFYTDGEEWYVDRVDAVDGWSYGLGSSAVTVAVIDTGYDPKQTEVAPNVTFAEKIVGGTIDTSASAAVDTDGHGTFLSSVVSAKTNNAAGFAGIGYGVSLQEYKVFTDAATPTANTGDEAYAIRDAVARGANVILLALGGTSSAGPDPLERDAVAYALSKNVVVVSASGDEGATTVDYPAAYPGVVAVGATSLVDNGSGSFAAPEHVAAYSNSGPGLTLVAPGGEPTSATDPDAAHWIVGAYTTQPLAGNPACAAGTAVWNCGIRLAGTSAAAAVVAGGVGVLLSDAPAASTPGTVLQVLASSADGIGDAREGAGRFNVHRAIAAALGDKTPSPPDPTPSFRQFVAFAYTNSGGTKPAIADVTFPRGAPVNADGTFRIADIPVAALGTYKIGVWFDRNGNGIVDAGDYFGATSAVCSKTSACSGANALTASPVAAGFVLP
jgi:serine protease